MCKVYNTPYTGICLFVQYTIRASAAGVVANVRCKEGEAVPRAALLVDFK